MANFNFDPSSHKEVDFSVIPVGNHRARVSDVVEKKSKSGNDMYEITLDVSGYNSKLWFYLVLMQDKPEQTNNKIGAFFDSFGISDQRIVDGIEKSWIGKVGAVRVKHEDYNGETQAKVSYCISKEKQEKLPPWKEPGQANASHVYSAPAEDFPDISDEDMQF